MLLTVRVKQSSKVPRGTNTILVFSFRSCLLQTTLFLVLLYSPVDFLLSFGVFKLGLGEKGHHQKLYVPVPLSGRPGLPKSSPSPLLA